MKNFIIGIVVAVVVVAGGSFYVFSSMDTNTPTPLDEVSVQEQTALNENEPVAIVNGQEILRAEYNAFEKQIVTQQGIDPSTLDDQMRSQIKQQVIDTLVSQTLLEQIVAEENITIPEEEARAQIESMKSQFESEEEFTNTLETEGLTEDELRSQINTELAIQSHLEAKLDLDSITVSNEEIQQMYEQTTATAPEETEVPPLEEVKEQIRTSVAQQKEQEKVQKYITSLREDADVEVLI